MGCDIHAYVEIREDGKWTHYDWRSKYEEGQYENGSTKYDWKAMFNDPLYIGRNYNLFAVLANVRNGHGFAGIQTGEGFIPIDMPRGLPDDVTAKVQSESIGWGVDGHSHSWFTVKELLNYDYNNQVTRQYGTVTLNEYKHFRKHGKPESWSASISGGRVTHVSNAEMETLIDSGVECDIMDPGGILYVTKVYWNESCGDAIGPQWFETLEALKELRSPEDVRLVFWFDN